MTNYPVVFFVFKRPKTTYDFLSRMSEGGIKKIYIFADGARYEEEKKLTDQVKNEITRFKKSHPEIMLITSFAPHNVGLRTNIISGLNTVFKKELAAIIIEDDCVVSPDFFRFTKAMLDRYQNESKVMSVNGMSVGGDYGDYSYGFTKYPQCWGWATWKRAWDLYDPTMPSYTKKSWQVLAESLGLSTILRSYFELMFKLIKKGQINTWDFQWTFSHLANRALAISPSVNLVSNIGFDSAATNTKTKTSVAELKAGSLAALLKHPKKIDENLTISHEIELKFYSNPVAILGLLRQYVYYLWRKYAHRS